MCLLCIEIAKDKMTPKEIANAFREMSNQEHAVEIINKLNETGKLSDVADELIEFKFDFDPLELYTMSTED